MYPWYFGTALRPSPAPVQAVEPCPVVPRLRASSLPKGTVPERSPIPGMPRLDDFPIPGIATSGRSPIVRQCYLRGECPPPVGRVSCPADRHVTAGVRGASRRVSVRPPPAGSAAETSCGFQGPPRFCRLHGPCYFLNLSAPPPNVCFYIRSGTPPSSAACRRSNTSRFPCHRSWAVRRSRGSVWSVRFRH